MCTDNINPLFIHSIPDVKTASNFNLESIVTPIKVNNFERLLRETNYDEGKTNFLIDGFTNGFSIHYNGTTNIRATANNLKLWIGSKLELWNKVITEVELKRYAGPFANVPEAYKDSFIQSPLGNWGFIGTL